MHRAVSIPVAGQSGNEAGVDDVAGDNCGEVALRSPQAERYPELARAWDEFADNIARAGGTDLSAMIQYGQVAWSSTGLAERQRQTLSSWLDGTQWRCSSKVDTIVDLGSGDGEMIAALLEAQRFKGRVKAVVLVDRNEDALERARRCLDRRHEKKIAVMVRRMDLRDPAIWNGVQPERTLAFASASLHELPRTDKATTLARAAAHVSQMLLVELASDHDSPRTGSTILTEHALWFYDALIGDAYASVQSLSDRQAIIGAFLLQEFSKLTSQPYERRVNYHLDARGWQTVLTKAGFAIQDALEAELLPGGPKTLFIAGSGAVRRMATPDPGL